MSEASETPKPKVSEIKKLWNAFKNFAIIFSFIVNFVLVMVLLLSPSVIFGTKSEIAEPVLTDLDAAFAALGKTVISSTIPIDHLQPVQFDLPLNQSTDVVLTEAVPVQVPATFFLPGGGGSINGTVSLNLPVDMRMPIHLSLTVPVSSSIRVQMDVPVRIPLETAGMGPAIEQLRAVFRPFYTFIHDLPNSPAEVLQGK